MVSVSIELTENFIVEQLKSEGFVFDFSKTNRETQSAFFLQLCKIKFEEKIDFVQLIDQLITKALQLCEHMPFTLKSEI